MEEKFYLDDFELSLQDQANDFKMAPSKKVWQGIYNGLHPGRRWPSITMSIVLLSAVLSIGFINSKKNHLTASNSTQTANISTSVVAGNFQDKTAQVSSAALPILAGNRPSLLIQTTAASGKSVTEKADAGYITKMGNGEDETVVQTTGRQPATVASSAAANKIIKESNIPDHDGVKEKSLPVTTFQENAEPILELQPVINEEISVIEIPVHNDLTRNIESGDLSQSEIQESGSISSFLAGSITNNSVKTFKPSSFPLKKIGHANNLMITKNAELKAVRRKFSKIKWTYYAAPFVSTVRISGEKNTQNLVSGLATPLPQVNQKGLNIEKSAALGFEAGMQMNYKLTKKMSLTAGAHFTRSGYNIISNIVHPVLSTVVFRDPNSGNIYSRSFVSVYGDGSGASKELLHNYNYQASLPVGIQYTLFGTDKVQFNINASVEPSRVLKADAFVLSSDGRNYVSVPDLIRKWNIGTNFGPYVSFRSSKLVWNIGPNIRYQWLSTFQDSYTIKQHLIDYGIRLGISR